MSTEVSRYTRHHRSRRGRSEVALADGILAARAMALVELALPGSIFIYNGAELGLPNADLPDEALQDPVWGNDRATPNGPRQLPVPIPWEGTELPMVSVPPPTPWLPMPDSTGAVHGGNAAPKMRDLDAVAVPQGDRVALYP